MLVHQIEISKISGIDPKKRFINSKRSNDSDMKGAK